ncbi:hypothetical protein G6F46_012845 [Rhizopus delemar]|uniref:Uncharacterized protein n=2 Tax=Rhizopus TaxID=4842 RepID=A0A9P6YQI4_9FUNG|nr:hypothetical protein G6F55_011494 [Rhizopus delemar]KAG1532666.1 hypothetical protein G6F51_012998 [Rhizopus arrhizus]KAG1490878.1 hypothetical protein G6F54_010410 [Rhizopus delemar]KAG1493204.1 hypothetical protein G6F53_012800 [Rhizopus delemar]KAG1511986.1 hypothetical protein G6F52_010519 [Rhizopus delemar]
MCRLKYEASVEPITSEIESLDMKKSPIPHVISPSLALKSPDDNDVRMYNPDDNYSISIRRSSIKASKTNQMEGGSITVYPSNMETKATVVPTIVYSDAASAEDHRFDTHAPTGDPPMYTPSGLKLPDQPHRPSSTPSSYTAHSPNLSPNGLGISHPTHSKDNNGLSPDLPGLSPRSSAEKNDNAPLSPKHHISPNHNLIVPLSPEISQAPRSPSIGSQQSPSMIGSIFSFKSSAIAPEVPVGNEDKKENTEDRFIAFKQRKGFNPFYLALISCAALTTAIVFMIIYDLVLLGMGNDIFG